jgi:hypothetical protein
MKPYFLSNKEYSGFIQKRQEGRNSVSGTLVKYGNDTMQLAKVIQKEIVEFRNNRNTSFQLTQKGVVVNVGGGESLKIPMEECAAELQKSAPNWFIRGAAKTSGCRIGILGSFSRFTVIKESVRAGLIRISPVWNMAPVVAAVGICFLLLLFLGWSSSGTVPGAMVFTVKNAILSISAAAFLGIILFAILRKVIYTRQEKIDLLCSELINQKGNEAYRKFVSIISRHLIADLPVAIIVDDITRQDEFTLDVIRNFTKNDAQRSTGSLLWIVFSGKSTTDTQDPFEGCCFTVNRGSIVHMFNF